MKRLFSTILLATILLSLSACSVEKTSTTKIRDIEFTVTEEKNIPEGLKSMMEEKEGAPFKLTYADQGALYIAESYGEKPTSGYSIEVKECFETESWLKLLYSNNSIDEKTFKNYRNLCGRIRRMLIASCKTLKVNAK